MCALRQENHCKLEASLTYIKTSKPSSKKKIACLEPGGLLTEPKPLSSMPNSLIILISYLLLTAGDPTEGIVLKTD